MSKHNITMEMLMYNRENFRDINVEKPKNVSRQEFNEKLVKNTISAGYQRYLIEKAKRNVKLYNETYNNAVSEVFQEQHQNDIYFRNKIGVVFQGNILDDNLTVKENLIFRGSSYIKRMFLKDMRN